MFTHASTYTGDWWHIRAALPVEPLNAAIELLSKWTQPTLMLVGNHDQVWVCVGVDVGVCWCTYHTPLPLSNMMHAEYTIYTQNMICIYKKII